MVLATSGPRRVRHPSRSLNVGEVERVLSVVGGGALAAAALKRRGAGGLALGAMAVALIHRGTTGTCPVYQRLGISTAEGGRPLHDFAGAAATVDARHSVKVEASIAIDAERPSVYDFWRRFENHPLFMAHVQSVESLADGTARYELALPGGRHLGWTSEIVKDYPGELISWKTVGDSDVAHAGSVQFRDTVDGLGTTVTVAMDYEPPAGLAGHTIARVLGLGPEHMVRHDLRRLKELLEDR